MDLVIIYVRSASLSPVSRTVDRPVPLFVGDGTLAPSLPWYAAMVLPVLFTAGITAFDSADGPTMSRIYSRATGDARRRVDYNIGVTVVLVFIAFLIGGMGLLSVVWAWPAVLSLAAATALVAFFLS